MERDNITRFGARAPGVEQQRLLERRRFNAQRPPAQNGDQMYATGSVKDRGKPSDVQAASNGQAQSDIPALKPYWGKPAVRNFREGHGNVGIIRSPLRAIALPDQSSLSRWLFRDPYTRVSSAAADGSPCLFVGERRPPAELTLRRLESPPSSTLRHASLFPNLRSLPSAK